MLHLNGFSAAVFSVDVLDEVLEGGGSVQIVVMTMGEVTSEFFGVCPKLKLKLKVAGLVQLVGISGTAGSCEKQVGIPAAAADKNCLGAAATARAVVLTVLTPRNCLRDKDIQWISCLFPSIFSTS